VDHPKPNLRIVEASQMEPPSRFDHAAVTSPDGDELGHVEGFVVDSQSGSAQYLVVDAGGWFRSKYFLLPIQNARLNSAEQSVVAELSREEVKQFPGFDKSEFKQLGDAELQQIMGFRSH